MTQQERDDAMRILGARDGYIGALVKVRNQIGYLTAYRPIDPRHVRKLARREAILAPLQALERQFDEQQKACGEAYKTRMSETV